MIIRLSHISYEALVSDIQQILPEWDGEVGYQGSGISVIRLPSEVLEEAVLNENGEIITPAVFSDEIRYDIHIHLNHLPEEIPVFLTKVTPEVPDHKIF